MQKTRCMLILGLGFFVLSITANAEDAIDQWPGDQSSYHSFVQYDFQQDGMVCKVVVPETIAAGRPWIWRARFFGHEPQTDIALLEKGYHVAYVDVADLYGSPKAVARWDAFYKFLTEAHGFGKKTVLEGMSRGGLIVFNWAIKNPDKVSCIYVDAPVCDFKSWPGINDAIMNAYGLTETEAKAYRGNPVDNLKPLAEAGIPLLHVVGDADEVVPVAENTAIVEQRYKELGGEITVIHKPGVGHHPHSLKDPTPIVDFILSHATTASPTDWLKDARIGAFMHFLPGDEASFAKVNDFDVVALATQLERMGAKYFVLTLGQNSGWYNAPNSVYDRITGYQPGERCAVRDLPLDLYQELSKKGIRLMLYLPCQVPNRDIRAQKAFGLPQGPKDQPLDIAFAKQWAEVIYEWSSRYGEKVVGWWFDGGYDHIHFNNDIAQIYADAVKRGNPKAIVTFNPGVKLVRHTRAEDYTAGELNEPFDYIPESRWVDGSQWHALTFLGSMWGKRDIRYPSEQWQEWFQKVIAHGGAVTIDMGPNMDSAIGPIGTFDVEQEKQFKAIAKK